MGFYPPDALIHEAQRRGIEVLPPDANFSEAECSLDEKRRLRVGLGYVKGVREQEVRELVTARNKAGGFRSLSDLASRAGAGSPSLELLAWSGTCDSLVGATGPHGELCPPTSGGLKQGDKVPAPTGASPCGSSASQRPGEQFRVGCSSRYH
jgi:error-prone DNA polymerase